MTVKIGRRDAANRSLLLTTTAGMLFNFSLGQMFLGRDDQDLIDLMDTLIYWGALPSGRDNGWRFPDGSVLTPEVSETERWADTGAPVVRLVPKPGSTGR